LAKVRLKVLFVSLQRISQGRQHFFQKIRLGNSGIAVALVTTNRVVRKLLLIVPIFLIFFYSHSQPNCTLQPPIVSIGFGAGDANDLNSKTLFNYRRVSGYCPTDGHYTYSPYTSECFRNDWHTLTEDRTPGDANGNMMLVNGSPVSGTFFITAVNGLKGGATYEFSVWLMNLCKITEKCPFPLLPSITIRLQTRDGKTVTELNVGEVERKHTPQWTQYRVMFTMPASSASSLTLNMMDNNPGGCGNDFAMDDITFRECVKIPPPIKTKPTASAVKAKPKAAAVKPKPKAQPAQKRIASAPKPVAKKTSPKPPAKKPVVSGTQRQAPKKTVTVATEKPVVTGPSAAKRITPALPPPPPALRTRSNVLVRRIEADAGDIRIDLFDNGEIDGDTVSIYHNNKLIISRAKLSEKPITLRVAVNASAPHHELVMVADNLGSIPPNTSLMIVTAGDNRHEVFISSTKQKNAKVVLDLKP
jgi:hypothetical protein